MIEDQEAPARAQGRREGHPAARVGWFIFGLALFALKVDALVNLFHDGRWWLFIVFGLGALGSFYRGKPLATAFSVAVIVAVAVRVHPWLEGIGLGVASFVVLVAVSVIGSAVARWFDKPEPGFGRGWL